MDTQLKPLTEMQQQFVQNYVSNGFNAKKAAIDAGYSTTSAIVKSSDMINNHPVISERIKKAHEVVTHEFEEKLGISLQQKLRRLARALNQFLPDEGEIKRKDVPNIVRLMNELSKMQGHYAPDRRLQVNVDVTKERLEQASKVYEEF